MRYKVRGGGEFYLKQSTCTTFTQKFIWIKDTRKTYTQENIRTIRIFV